MQRWGPTLWLFSKEEFDKLPNGFVLTSINGTKKTKGVDSIDTDIRWGHIAWGVSDPLNHPDAELFTVFRLES